MCVIRTGNVLSLSSSYISFRRKERREGRDGMNWSLLAVRLATDGRCLPKFSFKKYRKKKEGFFYIYFCVCVLSPPLPPPFVYTHRENNNNNNELYVFVLILKWRNELLSRDDNHRNHKLSNAKKRRSWNTTTTTCTTFFRRIGKKDAGSLVSTIPLFCACWLPWRPDLHTTLWVSPNGQRQVYSTRKKKQQMIINRVIV